MQLEPAGKFSHIAISFKGRWLHSHPFRGVELVGTEVLEQLGKVTIVAYPNLKEPSFGQVDKYLNKAYDPSFSWNDDRVYCSELVAKLLNIRPRKMSFETDVWSPDHKSLAGNLGISPDDIYKILTAPRCSRL